jgi:hypothetical protein
MPCALREIVEQHGLADPPNPSEHHALADPCRSGSGDDRLKTLNVGVTASQRRRAETSTRGIRVVDGIHGRNV